MTTRYQHTIDWFHDHLDIAFDLIRVYLGAGLLVRGLALMRDQNLLYAWMVQGDHFHFFGTTVVHYIAMAHVCGGILLIVGLLTRFAAIVQVPILVGAVFLVHMRSGLFMPNPSLEFSALVLFILLLCSVFGAGRLSLDHLVIRRTRARVLSRANGQ